MDDLQNESVLQLQKDSYWNQYYTHRAPPSLPSQFAVFVLGEIGNISTIIDIGCGNGRDSLFFASQGMTCIGVDGSISAIAQCRSSAAGLTNVDFVHSALTTNTLLSALRTRLDSRAAEGPVVVYARFLLHAVTDEEESDFIRLVDGLLEGRPGYVALEFRTKRDMLLPKTTDAHYRRYVDPVHFFSKTHNHGFEVDYFVEGFGYAKHRRDDAHVARFILKKRASRP